jgi:CRP/FNR family cyclic AMP-dependent transcriptional regulator
MRHSLEASLQTDDREKVLPRISQETLAGMIGTTRLRVNSFINKFREATFHRI